jgi:hypothetical protein
LRRIPQGVAECTNCNACSNHVSHEDSERDRKTQKKTFAKERKQLNREKAQKTTLVISHNVDCGGGNADALSRAPEMMSADFTTNLKISTFPPQLLVDVLMKVTRRK